jgi:glycosyltransferase involved in cell wall biosynthesis
VYKKILIITDNTTDQINGVVTTFKNLERVAAKDGYSFYFITPLMFKNYSCPGYPEVKLSLPYKLGKKIKKHNPDYIHIATEGPLGLAARVYLQVEGIKYNTSYHTKFPEFLQKMYRIPPKITYCYLRWFHKHSERVLTTSQTMVQELIDNKFKNNVLPWTRGVDRDNLKPTQEFKHTFYHNLKPIVLYVGRVSKEKNLTALCELQNYYNIEIVGDGPERISLERKYHKVKFLGYKTGSELADCYAKADVFCFPSKLDTFGIVMIEAMSLGTPIAAYPVTGPKDIIELGINGIMDDNLKTAIDKALKLDRNQVKQSSEIWTWEKCWEIFKNNLVSK